MYLLYLKHQNEVKIDPCIKLKEISDATADDAGFGQIWVKNTTPCQLWYTNDVGTSWQIALV